MSRAERTGKNSNVKTATPKVTQSILGLDRNCGHLLKTLRPKRELAADIEDETTTLNRPESDEREHLEDKRPESDPEDGIDLPPIEGLVKGRPSKPKIKSGDKGPPGKKRPIRYLDPIEDSSDSESRGRSSRGDMLKTRFVAEDKQERKPTNEERTSSLRQTSRLSSRQGIRDRLRQETAPRNPTGPTKRDETDAESSETRQSGKRKSLGGERVAVGSHMGNDDFMLNRDRTTRKVTFGGARKSTVTASINIFADQTKSSKQKKPVANHSSSTVEPSSSPGPFRVPLKPDLPPTPPTKRPRKQQGEREVTPDSPQATQALVFKTYDYDASSSIHDDGPITITSSPIQARSNSLAWLATSSSIPSSKPHVCPMCNDEVDPDLLGNFKRKHPRMTIDQEQRFCQLHKKNSAKTAWDKNGYPDIRWSTLDGRIAKRYGFLRHILEGGKSYYGDVFGKKVKDGQYKTLLKSEENLTPGYYGVRGLRVMSENIVAEFSTLLRKRAVKDRLVSARGHIAYVQSVLVPELTVQLVMEDMGVDEEEARVIMKESVWVGELLNEEVADVIMSDDESSSE